ncbi:MAG: DUF6286 domain-containing protein [Acidimicrobiales bacterium]|nr:DUF6286 domain-containing protein [Acidimicrobiales bacterium]
MTLLRRLLALLVAVAIGTAAVLVLVEGVGIRAGESPVVLPLDDWERRIIDGDWSRWGQDAWAIASAAVLGVGVFLVVLQLVPHRTRSLPRRPTNGPEVRFGRNGLEDRLHDVALDQHDIVGAAVKVKKRTIRVDPRVPRGADLDQARRAVRDAVVAELDRLELEHRPKLKVKAEHGRERVV